MKRILLTLISLVCLGTNLSKAQQCGMIPVSLENRIQEASTIVEGRVIKQQGFWDAAHQNIYTLSTVELYRSFKGTIFSSSIEVLSEGGRVANTIEQVSNSVVLSNGKKGILLVKPTRVKVPQNIAGQNTVYEVVAARQGFFAYDSYENTANEAFQSYLVSDLVNLIEQETGSKARGIASDKTAKASINKSQLVPVISGLSPTNISAGTRSILTINGSGFGSTPGSVSFKNADDGGATFIPADITEIVSWSNTQIKVMVPADAGTGQVRVDDGQGGTTISSSGITVRFAYTNIISSTVVHQPKHVNQNGSGGYTWQMFTGFDANTAAKDAFMRAFNTLRCGTLFNITTGNVTGVDAIAADGVNVIRFDIGNELPSGVLGRCTSRYSLCSSSGKTTVFVNEMDIVFDDATSWHYGTDPTPISLYDFETVTLHELGHGNQFGHVINGNDVMHYAVTNGAYKRALGLDNVEAGDTIRNHATTPHNCGPNPMVAYNTALCGSLAPVAEFSATPASGCNPLTVQFNDLSTQNPTSWSWDVDNDGTIDYTSKNPSHVYNTVGLYTVKLTVANAKGTDIRTKTGFVNVQQRVPASVTISANRNPICNNETVTFIATPVNGGTNPSYQWKRNGIVVAGVVSGTYTTSTLSQGDVIACVMTSSLQCTSGSPAASNTINIIVSSSQQVSVSIGVNKTTICQGEAATFTAVPTNGGSNPSYQWRRNGVDINGATSPTLIITTINSGDLISCRMTSNITCASNQSAISNLISMTVNPVENAGVNINTPRTSICPGEAVKFIATPISGGSNPSYQWSKNGQVIIGATSATFTTSIISDGDIFSCLMGSSAPCVNGNPATSNPIKITVSATLPVSVNISANKTNICIGDPLVFTATPTNVGTNPFYQWLRNNAPISGANSSTLTTSVANNGDAFSCVLMSDLACAVNNPDTSNSITITVVNFLPASINIVANNNNVCQGEQISFTSTIVNGGTTPLYQWYVNGIGILGATFNSFQSSTLNNADKVFCQMTSSLSCATGSPAASNEIPVTIKPMISPGIFIESDKTVICAGQMVNFTASATNGGPTPKLQWFVNGVAVPGATSPFTSSNALKNGDKITCQLISNAECLINTNATSNTIAMQVNPTPNVFLILDVDTVCMGTPSYVLSGGNPLGGTYTGNGVKNNFFTADTAGTGIKTITYFFKDPSSGCSATDTDTLFVTYCTGINEVSSFKDIQLQPNPFAKQSTLSLSIREPQDLKIMLIDQMGRTIGDISTVKNAVGKLHVTIDRETLHLASGLYYIQLKGTRESKTLKIFVE